MNDPHQEMRESPEGALPWYIPTRVHDRIRLGLSPCDDGLPYAQAVRQRAIMDEAVAYLHRKRDDPS